MKWQYCDRKQTPLISSLMMENMRTIMPQRE